MRFRRQHPIGPYIADFAAPLAHLVVELDGASHMTDEAHKFDRVRDRYLHSRGWTVLRFRNDEIYKNLSDVLNVIWANSPPPARGRRAPPPP